MQVDVNHVQGMLEKQMPDLGFEGGGSGGVGKEALLGVVCAHVPWGTSCCIKIVMPVLVKGVVGVGYCVNQAVVEDFRWSCTHKGKIGGRL